MILELHIWEIRKRMGLLWR